MKANNETYFELNNEFYNFTVVQNYILEDARITNNALGLYMRIIKFQNSPNHKIYLAGLVTETNKRARVTAGMNELIEFGYITRESIRNDKGQFKGYKYIVHMKPVVAEKPCVSSDTTESRKTDFGQSDLGETATKKENGFKKENLKKEKKDDDKEQSSIIIKKEDVDNFSKAWKEQTNKPILLTIKQKQKLQHLISEYGYEVVVSVLAKVKESKYLTENMTINHFLNVDKFINIANDTYKDHKAVTKAGNSSFTNMYSHEWDLDELEQQAVQHFEDEFLS